MKTITRRDLVRTSVAAGAIAATDFQTAVANTTDSAKLKIVAISCSPRPGRTTATSLKICLEAAQKVSERFETELIELAGLKINGNLAAGIPLDPGEKDDFPALVPKLTGLRRDLRAYLRYYNTDRVHTGRLTNGRIPADIVFGDRKMRPHPL